MKTATINVHHVFGTRATNYVDVCYRGKVLKYWMENYCLNDLVNTAKRWSLLAGFTHVKIVE